MRDFSAPLARARDALQQTRYKMAAFLSSLVPDRHTIFKAVIVLMIGTYALFQPYMLEYIAPFFGLSLAIFSFARTRRFWLALVLFPIGTTLVLLPYLFMYKVVIPSFYEASLTSYNQTEFGLMMVMSVLGVAGLLLTVMVLHWATERRNFWLGTVWLFVLSLCGASWYANDNDELRAWQLATYVGANVERLEHVPATVNRLLPQISAKGQINLDNRSNLYVPADKPHLSPGADKMYWCSPLYYKDNLAYNVLGMVRDVICIDSDKTDMQAAATTVSAGQDGVYEILSRLLGLYKSNPGDGFFWVGDQSFLTTAVLKLRHPFSTRDRVIYTYAPDGSRHYLITYVSRCPYALGAMVPCVGGVMDVSTTNWIRDLSIEEAEKLYPKAVFISSDFAATLIKAYAQFYTGIISKKFNQQSAGVMQMSLEERPKELAPEDFNPAPYITEFKSELRPQQMASLEPAGTRDGKALTALAMVDNYGHLRIFEPRAGSGPAMAITYAHNADPRVDWGHKVVTEDRPVIGEDDHIYWLVSVVNDNPRHPLYISSLVDSVHFTATAIHNARELDDFLKRAASGIEPVAGAGASVLPNVSPAPAPDAFPPAAIAAAPK
ncbi:MAG: hypothetical protein EKK48_17355 [Candidatus Melainabacteria bacterium]|nr:MAG: hypothetical protein EKK48_17355 [Candidatus Melainabacteria bacterium]